MKTRTLFFASYLLSASLFLIVSCQKELSFEIPPVIVDNSTVAAFTLGSEGNNCTGAEVKGTYMHDVEMNASNTAEIQVSVTKKGSYELTTDTVNGVSFFASGDFEKTGNQTVALTARGLPEAEGDKEFSISGATNKCSFKVSFSPKPPPATFSLAGAPNECTTPTIKGSYTVGVALSTANTVTLKVNVTKAGSYSITTNTVNGISFSGSGVFSATSNDIPVVLTGTGKPLAKGTTTLAVDMNTGCNFTITVADAPPVGSDAFQCKIDGKLINFTKNAKASTIESFTNAPALTLRGDEEGDGDDSFDLYIKNNDNTAVKAGTYDEKSFAPTSINNLGYQIIVGYTARTTDLSTRWTTISNAPPFISGNPAFTIKVTSITATRVKGTFSGKLANDDKSKFKTVTEGMFDLPVGE
ncbi:MAG: hypothetical protein ACTHLE_09450 [Agriterribacter sp.]